jgi:hypothetical protein
MEAEEIDRVAILAVHAEGGVARPGWIERRVSSRNTTRAVPRRDCGSEARDVIELADVVSEQRIGEVKIRHGHRAGSGVAQLGPIGLLSGLVGKGLIARHHLEISQ